ncbi:hypothetical protein QCA50_000271 [Cerrena zonata]|uniref:FAD-binding PCMH-type domain-containing protein n=1 Tax=Cerrena zonata TaxID=2478898 RepID=A0AAW0GZJ1_9APHY
MSDFTAFQTSFKGDLVTPTDPGYEQAIDRWASNAARKAKVVAFVKDPSDVALAIKYAKDNSIPIAIRGGGHSASGASSTEGGLVLDLSKYINGVTVDAEKRLGYVGGGAVWKTVDETAIKYGLATVGGTVNHTGVGGLILGGGYGWLSGQHGLAIDNLVQATVVVADGRALTASATENPDLFFGIRGGGCNFGVVTEFVLQLHPQRATVFAGPVIFAPPQLESVATALDKWTTTRCEKESIFSVMTRGPDGKPCVVAFVFYNGSEAEGREAYKFLFDLGPVASMAAEIPYETLNTLQNQVATPSLNYYMTGAQLSGIPSGELNSKLFERVTQLSEKDFNVNFIIELIPHGKINGVAPDATPYRRNLKGNGLMLIQWKHDTPEYSQKAKDAVRELSSLLRSDGEGYGNYGGNIDSASAIKDGVAPPDKSRKLFGDHYPKLQAIKKKYDPDTIFNKWFLIAPA